MSSRDASKPKPYTGVTEKGRTMTCREERHTVKTTGRNLLGMQTGREGLGSCDVNVWGCECEMCKGLVCMGCLTNFFC